MNSPPGLTASPLRQLKASNMKLLPLSLICHQFLSTTIPASYRVSTCNTSCSSLGSLSQLDFASCHIFHHTKGLPLQAFPCLSGAPTLKRAQTSLSSLSRAHIFFLAASWSWELRQQEERLSTEKKSEISGNGNKQG